MREKVKNIERPELIVFERIRERERLNAEKSKVLFNLESMKEDENLNDLTICYGIISSCVGAVDFAESGFSPSLWLCLIGGFVAAIGVAKNKKLFKENEELLFKLNEIDEELSAFVGRDMNAIDLIELDEDDIEIHEEPKKVRKL